MIMFENIAVADDSAANRDAAVKAIVDILPSATVHLFSSGGDIIAALKNGSPKIDLVLTDMKMEDEMAGYRVAVESWSRNIPATIISGGRKTHTTNQVVVGYPRAYFYGEKDNPDIWKSALGTVFSGGVTDNAILMAAKIGRRETPDYEHGRTCAAVIVIRSCHRADRFRAR